uniref:Uncharacterized protein n=1 Tax=Timema monikensis TaxID=170555 RepID=A0A7R9HLA6_9NEOP|nr:unnamed protein product [Timema monikensis]
MEALLRRTAFRVLNGQPDGKIPLESPRSRWEDKIWMALREIGCNEVDWIELSQDMDRPNGNPTSTITANNVFTNNKRTDFVPRKLSTPLVLPHKMDDTVVSALTKIRSNCSDSSSDYSDNFSWDTDFDDDKEQPDTHEPDKKNVSNRSRGERRIQEPSTTRMMTHSKGSGNTVVARPDTAHKPHTEPAVPSRPPIIGAKPTALNDAGIKPNGNPTSTITANNVFTNNKRTDFVPRKLSTPLVLPHKMDDTVVSALTKIRSNCSDSSSDYSDNFSWDTDFDDDKEQPDTHEPDKKNVSNGSRGERRMQEPSTTRMMTHSKGSGNTVVARPDTAHKPHTEPAVPSRPPIIGAKPTALNDGGLRPCEDFGQQSESAPCFTSGTHSTSKSDDQTQVLHSKTKAINVFRTMFQNFTETSHNNLKIRCNVEGWNHSLVPGWATSSPIATCGKLSIKCDDEEQYESIDNVDLPSREAIAALFNHSNTAKLLNTSQNQPSFFKEPRQSDSSHPSLSLHPSSSQEQLSQQIRRSPQPEKLAVPKTEAPSVPPTAIVSPYKSQVTKPVPITNAIPSRPLPPHPVKQSQPARSFPSQPQVLRPPAIVPEPEEEQYECMEDSSILSSAPNKNDGYISDEYESIKDNQFKIHFGVPVPNITDYYLQPVHKQKDNDIPPPLPMKPKPNIEIPSIRPPSPPRKKLEDQSSSSSSPGNSGDGVVTGLFGELLRKVRNRPATYTSDKGERYQYKTIVRHLISVARMSDYKNS